MKKLLIMLLFSTLANAQVKTHYTDFYYDDDYLFSLIQVWEQQDKAGEPVPLPWRVTGYVYADKTGLQRLYASDEATGLNIETQWLKESTWKQFSDLNNLPNAIFMNEQGETLVFVMPEVMETDLVWYLKPDATFCEHNEIVCGRARFTIMVPLTEEEKLRECNKLRYVDIHEWIACIKAVRRGEAPKTSLEGSGKVFTMQIDLSKNTIAHGIDDKGAQPYMPIY